MDKASRKVNWDMTDMDSSSDDSEGVSHFVLPKPQRSRRDTKRQNQQDGCKIQTIIILVCVCIMVIVITSLCTYMFFVHARLAYLENLVLKLLRGTAVNVSSADRLKLTTGQLDEIKKLLDVANITQLHRNLSAIHDQFTDLQNFFKDVDSHSPSIVQFLSSMMQQLTPLSQSVVLMSDSFQEMLKTVNGLELDRNQMKQSIEELSALTQNLELSYWNLSRSSLSTDIRLSLLESINRDGDVVSVDQLQAVVAQMLSEVLQDHNATGSYLGSDCSSNSKHCLDALKLQIANSSHQMSLLDAEVQQLAASVSKLEESSATSITSNLVENRMTQLEEKFQELSSIIDKYLNVSSLHG